MKDNKLYASKAFVRGNAGKPFSYHVGAIIFLTAIFYLNFLSRIILSPLVPVIEEEMGLSHSAAGMFFLLITVGYFISLLCSGFITARVSHRRTIIISSLSIGVVFTAVSVTGTAMGLGLVMLLTGLATGVYLPSGIATITNLVERGKWGQALAIHEIAPNLACFTAPLVVEVLMGWLSWRGVLVCVGFTALCFGISFAVFGHGGEFRGERPNFGNVGSLIKNPAFLIMVLLMSMGIAGSLGMYTMLPLYLVGHHGLSRGGANTLIAMSRVVPIVFVFLGGWATDRYGAKRTLKWVFLMTGMITILIGALPLPMVKAAVLIQPIFAVCFFPPGFAVLSAIVPERNRNLAISLATPVAFTVGGGIVPTGIGFLGDLRLFPLAFMLVGACILLLGTLGTWRLRY